MKIFDLRHNLNNTITGVIWDERNKNNISYTLPQSSVSELCSCIMSIFPDDFPSRDQLIKEIKSVHSLNLNKGLNSFGDKYPADIPKKEIRRVNF